MTRYSEGDVTVTQTGFGASGGINVNLPMGLGFHAAVDLASLPEVSEGSLIMPDLTPMIGGIGIHYKIAVPSLGMPLVPVVN
jgi:hypothetical protein